MATRAPSCYSGSNSQNGTAFRAGPVEAGRQGGHHNVNPASEDILNRLLCAIETPGLDLRWFIKARDVKEAFRHLLQSANKSINEPDVIEDVKDLAEACARAAHRRYEGLGPAPRSADDVADDLKRLVALVTAEYTFQANEGHMLMEERRILSRDHQQLQEAYRDTIHIFDCREYDLKAANVHLTDKLNAMTLQYHFYRNEAAESRTQLRQIQDQEHLYHSAPLPARVAAPASPTLRKKSSKYNLSGLIR